MELQQITKTNQGNHQRETQLFAKPALPLRAQVHPLLHLQRALGNQALGRFIQAKLKINQPGDVYEQEADRVAEQVMRMPEPLSHDISHSSSPSIQRKCATCASGEGLCPQCAEEEKMMQRKPLAAQITPLIQRQATEEPEEDEEETIQTKEVAGGAPALSPAVESQIDGMRGGGQPLSASVRASFEPRFGHDFSGVRVHVNGEAATAARAVHARAYTLGRDIVFGSGEYAPATMEGKRLLAHELAHVVQQGHSRRRDDSLTRGFMENEVARVNTLSVRSDRPALDEALLQKQRAQVRLSTRSTGESPAVVSRQKTSPDETSGNQRGAKNKPKDWKQISKDLCFNEPIDDTKARCQFSSGQLIMVRIIKEHALRACTRAIAAINMPGNEGQVIKIAKDYFHLNIKLSEKTKRTFINAIKAVSDKLEHSAIECGTCQDKHCNGGAIAHVDEARTFLVLCHQFFNSELHKVYLTPRFLIHEAGHLARLDENTNLREEFYCDMGATKEEKCPVIDAIHNVDAWSHFIEELAYTI